MSALRHDAAFPVGPTTAATQAWTHRGVLRVTIVAKATFAFAEDAVMSRVAPQPIFPADVNYGNSPMRTARYAADRVPYLQEAEVLFTGRAHTPDGKERERMLARLGVFDGARVILDKTLVVQKKGGFTEMPIVYERAYGGIGWMQNPLGVGAYAGSGEPNVLDPVEPKRLAGFGPLGAVWPTRKALLGSLPLRALEAELVALPDDFDFGFFHAALADQRVPFLRGDEWIVMDGLHKTSPRARMRLPGARGLARVHGLGRWGIVDGQPLALHADTLRIDGDEGLVTLSVRGAFPVASPDALAGLRVAVGVELPGEPIAWPSAEEMPALAPSATPTSAKPRTSLSITSESFESVGGDVLIGTLAMAEEQPAEGRVMPFRPGPAPDEIARAASPDRAPRSHPLGATLSVEAIPDFGPALPFPGTSPVRAAPVVTDAPARPEPKPPEPKPVAPSVTAAPKPAPPASPWAPAPPPKAAPTPAPPKVSTPAASPALKKGLYGKFGSDR